MKEIPAAIQFRKFRDRNYLSQDALAREMKTCLRTILYIENGQREPSKRTWEKFKLTQHRLLRRKRDAKRLEQKKLARQQKELQDA